MIETITNTSRDTQPAAPLSLTVGTAGHIDHGKTALIKSLTGQDTDTLPEERARGITINLGFATFTLPDNRRIGIVDVPGHERFIHNMVAGATGIDLIMLVIAADDGIMPQTIEHFHILRLLGITSGLIVITKTDLVDPARVEAVTADIRHLVAGSLLEQAPIVPVSSKTGAGLDQLRDTLTALVDHAAQREASGPFRMPVERVIYIKGIGIIVAGIPRSGRVHIGDTVELLPAGDARKVKGIRFFNQDVETGYAGQLLGLRLSHVSGDEIKRGTVLAAPGYFTPTKLVNVRFQAMASLDKPLAPRTAVRFHLGTAEVSGHLVLPTLTPLASGQETHAQFQLNEPVVAVPGDFFLARIPSPANTIGGGAVVSCDTRRLRRRQNIWLESVQEQDRARHDPAAILVLALRQAGNEPLGPVELARRTLMSESSTRHYLEKLVKSGEVIECDNNRYSSATALAAARDELLATLNRLHDAAPLAFGFPKKDIMGAIKSHPLVNTKAFASLVGDGTLLSTSVGYQVQGRVPKLSAPKALLAGRIAKVYLEACFATPRVEELSTLLGAPEPVIAPVFNYLVQTGELVRVSDTIVLHHDCLEDCRHRLVDHLTQHGSIDAGDFKDLLGITRKYAIPLLEYWDRQELTRREGNHRKLKLPVGFQ